MTQLALVGEHGPERVTLPADTQAISAKDLRLWVAVQQRQAESGCTCPLRPGMTEAELVDLGMGCTAGIGFTPGWLCPTLAWLRRVVERRR